MGGVAALARASGHRVTGCDMAVYPPMSAQLQALGIEVLEGYDADQVRLAPDLYVVGNVVSRVRLANGSARYALMEAILDQGLPYCSGPAWLAQHVLQGRHVIAIAGTHGKTTTTAMLAWVLECCGLKPGFLVGGVPLNFGISARLAAAGAPFVIEADEYDTAFFDKRSKFVHYQARTAILNNLEFDHADIFDTLADIERQFSHLLRIVPASGLVISNAHADALERVLHMGCYSRLQRFAWRDMAGPTKANGSGGGVCAADFTAHGPPEAFTVRQHDQALAQVEWSLTGQHNQMNALACFAAAMDRGAAPADIAHALGSFQSVRRRLEVLGVGPIEGVTVYDDFAHHPTAIRTTVAGLRRRVGPQARILAVFEPRSATMKLGTLKEQLPWSLADADLALCHSGGLDWDARAVLRPMGERALVFDSIEALHQFLQDNCQSGDHVLCMSNGSFGGLPQRLVAASLGPS